MWSLIDQSDRFVCLLTSNKEFLYFFITIVTRINWRSKGSSFFFFFSFILRWNDTGNLDRTDTANVEFIKINYERRWNYLDIQSNRFPSFEFILIIGGNRSSSQWWNIVCPRIIVRSSSNPFSIRKPSIEIHPSRNTWYIWRHGEFWGVEAFEISEFEMSTQVFRDRWNVEASDIARNTHNPIRSIVESLVVEPNPAKSVISLSIGEIFFFYACICVRMCASLCVHVCVCVCERVLFHFVGS